MSNSRIDPQPDLVATLRATATRTAMFTPGQTVVVGVSGGPDSTALFHALAGLRDAWQLTLVVAHVDHGLRGAESAADAAYVAALCDRLNAPFRLLRADVPAIRRRHHLSTQEAARNVRHAFLRHVAEEIGAERIALGHNRDDRVETILLNLLRGTGLEGLQGFPAVRLPIVRPLYDLSRAQIESYCALHNLQPRIDSSNAKDDYLRNRIRTELLPQLTTYYSERADYAILRTAELVAADNTLLEALAQEALADITGMRADSEWTLDASALNALPLALRRRTLRQAIAHVRGHLQGIGFEMLERWLAAAARGGRAQFVLPSGGAVAVRLTMDGATVRVAHEAPPACPLPWACLLNVPGQTHLPRAGVVIEAVLCGSVSEATAWAARSEHLSAAISGEKASRLPPVLFPLRAVTLPLLARSWRPGDRIRLPHIGGSKKLQDLFTDAKIPANERSRVPILVDANGQGRILAVVGVRADETAIALKAFDTMVGDERIGFLTEETLGLMCTQEEA